jgi:hypothetical protein
MHRDMTIAHVWSLSWASRIQFTPLSQSPQDPFYSHPPFFALVFQVVSFLWASPPKLCTLLSHPMRATCPGDEYKLWSNFLHSPVTFPLRYTEQQSIQIKWNEIWSHNSTYNVLWGELRFSCILSYFCISRVIFTLSITYKGNLLSHMFPILELL